MTFMQVLEQKLGVMDLTCASMCMDGNVPMIVFNLSKAGNIEKAVRGDSIGTLITN